MYLAVQVIDVAYGKEHRGAPDAARRASLPRGVPLPHHEGDSVLHDCRLTSWADYEALAMVSGVPMQQGLTVIGGRLHIRPDGERLHFAAAAGGRSGFDLATGEWARVMWNEFRHDNDRRWQAETTVNAGVFRGMPATNVFQGEPTTTVDWRYDLLRNSYRFVEPR